MDKRKIMVLSVLAIFVVGMSLASVAAVDATTVTMKAKLNKVLSKKSGKYTVSTYSLKNKKKTHVYVFLKKGKKIIKGDKYKTKVYAKVGANTGVSKWRKFKKTDKYHHYYFTPNETFTQVKVKF